MINANSKNNVNFICQKKNDCKSGGNMGKLLLLTLNEQEEKVIDKIIPTISDCISLETVQTFPVPALRMSFPGLEIRQNQHRVFQAA